MGRYAYAAANAIREYNDGGWLVIELPSQLL